METHDFDVKCRGATIWFTGLPGSGKTTLVGLLAKHLRKEGVTVESLDGDEMRRQLSPDLGFSRRDRAEHVSRVGFVARLLARNGVVVLVAVIAPFEEDRERVRRDHERDGVPFSLVHLMAPVTECSKRDPKGLYALQKTGLLVGLTGVDAIYEVPQRPDARIATFGCSEEQSARHALLHFCNIGVTKKENR